MEKNEVQTEVLYSKSIPKISKKGMPVGSLKVETKTFNDSKFIQLSQEKYPFGDKPGKRAFVTIDPSDKSVREAIAEAYKN